MGKTKISELPVYTGDTSGVFVVMDSADLSATYRVAKEDLVGVTGTTNNLAYFHSPNEVHSWDLGHIGQYTFGLGTSAYDNNQPEMLMVSAGQSYNIATFQSSNNDSYAEVNIKNFGSGSESSADLVLWNDSGTESSSYVDLGINSSNYSAGYVGYGGDAYLINASNDLYIGSVGTSDHGHTHLFAGNLWQSSSISIYQDGTIGFGVDWINNNAHTIPSTGFKYEFSGSVKLGNSLSVVGNITGSIVSSTNNGSGTNFKVGDDAWMGDVNRSNTVQIMGQQDSLQGYIKFGSGSASPSLGYGGSNDHVDLSCALKLNQMATLPTATVGTLAVSGSHLYFHNGTGWNQVA